MNNTHVFVPYISVIPITILSGWKLNCNWLILFWNLTLVTSLISVFPEGNHKFLKVHAPPSLFRVGLVSFLMEIASLTLRGINLSSLHRTLILSISGLCPVFWWCSAMAERLFATFAVCSFSISPIDQSVAIQLPPAEDGNWYHWTGADWVL